jgi:peptide/nickel transport system ATP-binding protein
MSALYTVEDVSLDLPLAGGSFAFLSAGQRRLNLLSGITLAVEQGQAVGLVGESGSGKTTLARAMLGLVPISSGTLRFEGTPLRDGASFAMIRRTTAMLFQDSVASLSPRQRIDALLLEPFAIHGIRLRNPKAKVAELLDTVGLSPSLSDRYPHELSGGQARRVCIARALALEPRLVVADEPTAGLDVSVQGEILNLLMGLKATLGLGFLIISHNLSVVRHVTDSVAILYLGRMVETGPTRDVFANPHHPYTQSLIASEPQPDPRKRRDSLAIAGEIPSVLHRPAGCAFHSRCPIVQQICRDRAPVARNLTDGRSLRCHFRPNS